MYMQQLGQWRSHLFTHQKQLHVIVVLVYNISTLITMPSELMGHGFTYWFLSSFDGVVVGSEAVPLGREAWTKWFLESGEVEMHSSAELSLLIPAQVRCNKLCNVASVRILDSSLRNYKESM